MLTLARQAARQPFYHRPPLPTRALSTLAFSRPSSSLSPLARPRPLPQALRRPAPSSPFLTLRALSTTPPAPSSPPSPPSPEKEKQPLERRENIYTLPNALTVARILATPAIGYYVLQGDWAMATGLLAAAGVSDLVDGYLARRFNMGTVLGSILDPAADKLLMTTLVVTLAMKGMLPIPLAVLIIGRDVALSISAFYFRYASLPPPKTFTRYWDFSIPSASVHPTQISKYNTFLQLLLVGFTTITPLLPSVLMGVEVGSVLTGLQWIVAGTTVWSGLSYVGSGSRAAVKYIK
ncbi:hypothetical protein JCM10213v2_003614 [Rhodosporidiobolus nylandii]